MTKLTMPMVGECATWLGIVSQLYTARLTTLLETHGITVAQFGILHHITQPSLKGGSRISDIARAVEVGQPAVTKTATKFQNMGWVEVSEDPNDKRVRHIRARPEAYDAVNNIRQALGPDLFGALSSIDDDKIENFVESLTQLGNWLDQNRL